MPKKLYEKEGLNLGELLVLAADDLTETFHLNDLILRAWTLYPKKFSFEHNGFWYWSDHKVRAYVSHKSGPVSTGMFNRVKPSYYSLSEEGRKFIRRQKEREKQEKDSLEGSKPPRLPRLPLRSDENLLIWVRGTQAYKKFYDGKKYSITPIEYQRLLAGLSADEIIKSLRSMEAYCEANEAWLNGEKLTPEAIRRVRHCVDYLEGRYRI